MGTPIRITAEPHLFRKGCTRPRRVKPSCRWRPATRLTSQHPRS
jgi:hypothetical protein